MNTSAFTDIRPVLYSGLSERLVGEQLISSAGAAEIAEIYEMQVDNAVDSISSLIEPMIMSILGIMVGGLMIAMYLPIFMLGSVM